MLGYPMIIPRKWGKKKPKKRVPKDVKSWSVFLGPKRSGHWPPQIAMITEQQYGHESFGFHTKISHILATTRNHNQPRNPYSFSIFDYSPVASHEIDPVLNHDFRGLGVVFFNGKFWSPKNQVSRRNYQCTRASEGGGMVHCKIYQ